MNEQTRNAIFGVSEKLARNYRAQNITDLSLKANLPDRQKVYDIMEELQKISFPGYFGTEKNLSGEFGSFARFPDLFFILKIKDADSGCAERRNGKGIVGRKGGGIDT